MNLTIWSEDFWLPKNTTWNDFNQLENSGVQMPRIHDLVYVYPLAVLLYLTRVLFERYVSQPLGRLLRIEDSRSTIRKLSNHHKLSDNKQVKRSTRIGPLGKFSESTWRFTFYLSIFLYGAFILNNVRKISFRQSKHSFVFDLSENLVMGYTSLLVKLS